MAEGGTRVVPSSSDLDSRKDSSKMMEKEMMKETEGKPTVQENRKSEATMAGYHPDEHEVVGSNIEQKNMADETEVDRYHSTEA